MFWQLAGASYCGNYLLTLIIQVSQWSQMRCHVGFQPLGSNSYKVLSCGKYLRKTTGTLWDISQGFKRRSRNLLGDFTHTLKSNLTALCR